MSEENSFLRHDIDEVRFGTYRPEDVADALEVTRERARIRLEALIAVPTADRTFANTVLAYLRSREDYESVERLVGYLNDVLPGWSEARAVATAARNSSPPDSGLLPAVLTALRELADGDAPLTGMERAVLADRIRRAERAGVTAPEPVWQELQQISTELAELGDSFKRNMLQETRRAGFLVSDRRQLAGLGDGAIAEMATAARQRGLVGFWVGVGVHTRDRVLKLCPVAATRQRMYDERIGLAGDLNGPVLARMMELRRRRAELVGFETYVDLVTANQMAGSRAEVARFLGQAESLVRPLADAEHQELQRFARRHSGNPRLILGPADLAFYRERQKEHLAGYDTGTLMEYFPRDGVVTTMFWLAERLFGVSFAKGERATWHPDVQVYEMRDESGRHLATLYADWMAREDKRAGAWHTPQYSPPRGEADNGKPIIGFLTTNIEPPFGDEPAFFGPHDMQVALHEFGHFLHNALSRSDLPPGGPRDFREGVAQLLENWFFEPEVLARARHYSTGEPLPEKAVQAILRGRTLHSASTLMTQLSTARLDHELHTMSVGEDLFGFSRAVQQRFSNVPVQANDRRPAQISHLASPDYAGLYYSYRWSEGVAAALHEDWVQRGTMTRSAGREFVDNVLSRVDVEPADLLAAQLGYRTTGGVLARALVRSLGMSEPIVPAVTREDSRVVPRTQTVGARPTGRHPPAR